jgi:RP/EB family microtubule-associated protein
VACQLLDRIYPGKVPLSKVNWDAKLDYEFLANYKVLQNAFTKLKIDKQLPVERLVRAKYQDNLEFMQWFKRFYELNNPALDYDPVAARAGGKGAGSAARVAPAAGSSFSNSTRVGGAPSKPLAGRTTSRSIGSSSGSSSSSGSGSGARDKENSSSRTASNKPAGKVAPPAPVVDEVLVQKAEALRQENATLQATIEGLEKERDFYFEKLTVVEEMLQERQTAVGENVTPEVAELVEQIFKVLYATESTTAPPASVASVESPEAAAAAVAAPSAVV